MSEMISKVEDILLKISPELGNIATLDGGINPLSKRYATEIVKLFETESVDSPFAKYKLGESSFFKPAEGDVQSNWERAWRNENERLKNVGGVNAYAFEKGWKAKEDYTLDELEVVWEKYLEHSWKTNHNTDYKPNWEDFKNFYKNGIN